jgi:hypothetical protein
MDKYGVQLDEEKTKEAGKDRKGQGEKATTCPICSAELDSGGACPIHGTEPFESR